VKKYLIYHLRWQISGVVMMPVLLLTKNLGTIAGVIIAQFLGAIIFWFVDKYIFTK